MNTSLQIMLAAGMTMAAFGTTALAQDAPANGRNAHLVKYVTERGQAGGFFQEGRLQWREERSGRSFHYREVNRDEWSVYLNDSTRNLDVQLDLFKHTVSYNSPYRSRPEVYTIQEASSKSNGRIARMVSYTDRNGYEAGRFSETGRGMWIERDTRTDREYRLRETGRDDWSVYLTDDSRGLSLQLDLHTRTVYFSNDRFSHRPMYQIAKAF